MIPVLTSLSNAPVSRASLTGDGSAVPAMQASPSSASKITATMKIIGSRAAGPNRTFLKTPLSKLEMIGVTTGVSPVVPSIEASSNACRTDNAKAGLAAHRKFREQPAGAQPDNAAGHFDCRIEHAPVARRL